MRVLIGLVGCGGTWDPGPSFHVGDRFPLECAHGQTACESCHTPDLPLGPVDPACAACHLEDRPVSHDPARTGTCEQCHANSCGWDEGTNPHPPGFDAAPQHGVAANLQDPTAGDCRMCHGADLTGDSAQGCDDCHAAAGEPDWRTDCVFCHGGENGDLAGLPPQDLDNEADEDLLSFKAHPEHSDGDAHPLWGCEWCHGAASAAYVDALVDVDHWWDATPGVAEVDFTGLASGATYTAGSCANLYCHGTGITDGSESDGTNGLPCSGCHRMPPTSGEHDDHDHDEYPCTECHASTSDTSNHIIGPDVHVDGTADVDMAPTNSVNWNGNTCSGTCHGEGHSGESW